MLVMLWVFVSAIAVALLGMVQYRAGLSELYDHARTAETLLAEKLAQHDAHLSALGAIIRMSPEEPSASMQGLSQNILARYPRINEISTLHVDDAKIHLVTYGGKNGPLVQSAEVTDDLPKLDKIGQTTVRPAATQHAYYLFKLVAPDRLLRLRIDAEALLGVAQLPAQYSVSLALGDVVLAAHDIEGGPISMASAEQMSGNPAQPLLLEIGRGFGFGELFPIRLIVPALIAIAAVIWLAALYRDSSRQRRLQEQRVRLLEQDAKLAHVGRVNSLGEMASGIAHELSQPVAAILSQSQAARRAMNLGRSDILEQALDANVREAKRAGDILERMRAYISGAAAQMEKVPLSEALAGTLRLVEADMARRGITLNIRMPTESFVVAIDVISFQQVIHNLIRNAADAVVSQVRPRITLTAKPEGRQIVITVSDNGPGIEPVSLPRIFEPFFTTKSDGMGLGLPLAARLIEKMDGTIEARNDGGACFTIRLPVGEAA
ncbi:MULTISPECIES: sensor histidine kinase [unclassified Rhizobium]|uniref:sensor histidine kinase n=1 Tax=unclassified Rhizobium TaxID=2613769 RepID=UPI001AD9E846|nr:MULTISPECIES: ATP-binding protein [unclassified Rhizobium]MBO9123789.1 hypothetical protein [Rhizobium sp. 16-488-2b]MBO9174321.1 hypothetical protein [Rhizobium sp. 16-488-2a]